MQNSTYAIRLLSFLSLPAVGALLFFATQTDWIIWRGPMHALHQNHITQTNKQCNLYYWQQQKIEHEIVAQHWTQDEQLNLYNLLTAWTSLLYDERCINHKLSIESVMLTPSKQLAYISFDCNPFDNEQAIHEKYRFIETLCKTIGNLQSIEYIHLLVHHNTLSDPHLDFQLNWNTKQNKD